MSGLWLPRGDRLLVAAGAVLLALAYPPFHLLVPSFVCLVPSVLLLQAGQADARPLRRHLAQGFWFGLASSGLVLYWMVVALWHFTPLSAAGYAATILVLGGYHAVLFGLMGWVSRVSGRSWLVVFPVFWTALEWVVGHQGDIRFPWLGLGTSLTGYPILVQLADVVGARGITLLLAAANAALAIAWVRRGERAAAGRLAGAVLLGILLAAGYGIARERTLVMRPVGKVTVIQPNVGFREKWNAPAWDSLVNDLIGLSAEALSATHPDLVAWPEAAVPYFLIYHPDWESKIADQARRAHRPLVVGGVDLKVYEDRSFDYYNAAFVFDSAGQRDARSYHKRYLVPIVERVPFINPKWFSKLRWFGGFGIGAPGAVYQTAIGRFGVLICYESAFEDLTRDYRQRGADFFVNITNDAWFGQTAAPYQHAAHLVMRAIETRSGIARAANSGISEFVDPLGRTFDRTKLGTRAYLARVLVTSDTVTPYVWLGDWVGWLVVVGALVLVVSAWRVRTV